MFSLRRKSYRKKNYKSYSSKKKNTPLRKLVRREISRNIENKTVQYYKYDTVLRTVGDSEFPNYNVFPVGIDPSGLQMAPGTGQGGRIGNQVKTKKLMFKGTLVPVPYDAIYNPNPQPIQVKMYIFYDKLLPTNLPNPQAALDFFQNGNSTKGFQNDLVDMWSPVNTDRYRVLAAKVFKLGYAVNGGSGASVTSQSFANNDFKLNVNFSFDLTKHYPQMVKFNDGSSVPTTRGLFCMIQYVAASGQAFPTGYRCAVCQYMLDYKYEDA